VRRCVAGRHRRRWCRSAYSDTNYQLLTAIIEATTGTTYGDAVQQRIAAPLGLDRTYVAGHEPRPSGETPVTLYHKGDALDLPRALASEQGAGGIVSTLDDQLQFSAAYHQGRLFDPRHAAEMRRWNRLFFPLEYGYGLMRYRLPRWMTGFRSMPELVGHSGATNSFAFHAPELGCHIVGALNQLDKPSQGFKLITKVAAAVRRSSE
ncbi:MAG: serine hydrolase domain-containing protein, partial [Actinomycetota bacterium]